nr:MAG TPA: hypothetical protein [Caudoviricetes sp.]
MKTGLQFFLPENGQFDAVIENKQKTARGALLYV